MLIHHQNYRSRKRRCTRQGSAVTELAVLVPVLAFAALGAIDAGQCVNVSQIVNDASREGARLASRSDTTDVEEVDFAVESYIAAAFSSETSAAIAASVSVDVVDSHGVGLRGADLSEVESGTPITVRVAIPYATVRWLPYLPGIDAISIETETVIRRE